MIRSLRFETQRYGEHSVLGDSVYDRPFQWGSKRTGPDLARIGGKYSDAWQRLHLIAPRTLVPESNMPNYGWLAEAQIDRADVQARMRVLRRLGDPYSDADIEAAWAALKDKSELDAIVAYLQGLGVRP
jgi:cytochrome c oxidase cbb3-type subunit 2